MTLQSYKIFLTFASIFPSFFRENASFFWIFQAETAIAACSHKGAYTLALVVRSMRTLSYKGIKKVLYLYFSAIILVALLLEYDVRNQNVSPAELQNLDSTRVTFPSSSTN